MKRFLSLFLLFILIISCCGFSNSDESSSSSLQPLDVSSLFEVVESSGQPAFFAVPPEVFQRFFTYYVDSKTAVVSIPSGASENLSREVVDFISRVSSSSGKFAALVSRRSDNGIGYNDFDITFFDISAVNYITVERKNVFFAKSNSSPIRCVTFTSLADGSIVYPESIVTFSDTYLLPSFQLSFLSGSFTTSSYYNLVKPYVDTSFPVSSFRFDLDLTPSFDLSIDYQFDDGSSAAPPYRSSVKLGAAYIVPSPALDGYVPNQVVVSGNMPETDFHLVVTYSPKPYKLSVDFLNDTGGIVAPSVEKTIFYKALYSLTCPSVVGLTPERENVIGVMPSNDLFLSVAYAPNSYTLTVNYVNADGTKVFDPVILTVLYGDSYSVSSPLLDGSVADVLTVSGDMPPNDLSVTVTYILPKPPITSALEDSINILSLSFLANVISITRVCISILCIFVLLFFLVRLLKEFSCF